MHACVVPAGYAQLILNQSPGHCVGTAGPRRGIWRGARAERRGSGKVPVDSIEVRLYLRTVPKNKAD